jgi:hypothetical protein
MAAYRTVCGSKRDHRLGSVKAALTRAFSRLAIRGKLGLTICSATLRLDCSALAEEQGCRSGGSTASSILSTGPSSRRSSASAERRAGVMSAAGHIFSGSFTSVTVAGGILRLRVGVTARVASSGSGCATRTCSATFALPRWCWPLPIATTTPRTTRTPTSRPSASAVTCSTIATSINGGAGALCFGVRRWEISFTGRIPRTEVRRGTPVPS